MSENMKPVEHVFKTQRIIDIVNNFDVEESSNGPLSLKEMKRKELLEKMTSDKDKRDFMYMFNGLMISVTIMSLVHTVISFSFISLSILILSIGYFIFVRRRLTQETLKLAVEDHQNEQYLWKGFYLKELRFSAIKFAYLLFFPFLLVLLVSFVNNEGFEYFLTNYFIALMFSCLFWLFFFMDDQQTLDKIESELNTLKYL